jgi:hypothetical protein
MPTGKCFPKGGNFSGYKNAKIKGVVAVFLSLSFVFGLGYAGVAGGAAGVPQIMSYQGRLTDTSGNLLGGTGGTQFFFKFSIWDNPVVNSGSQLWPVAAPGIASTSVVNGVFNFDIGDTANGFPDTLNYDFYSNANVYLQVEVATSSGGTYEKLSPRQRIDSSGFAINAQQVGSLIASSGVANLATTTVAALTVSGTSTFTGLSAMQLLTFSNATGTALNLSGGGTALQVTAGTSVLQGMTFTNATGTSANIGSVLYSSAGIVPGASFTIGTSTKDLTLQGATTTIASAAGDNVVITAGGKVSVSSGNVDIFAGALSLNGITRIDNLGQATLATSTIFNLTLTNPLRVGSGGSGGVGPFTRGILIASGTDAFSSLSGVAAPISARYFYL